MMKLIMKDHWKACVFDVSGRENSNRTNWHYLAIKIMAFLTVLFAFIHLEQKLKFIESKCM